MTRMKTSTKEVTIYTVAGKKFLDKSDALAYEEDLMAKMTYVYHVVQYDPMKADSFDKDKTPKYQKEIIYAVPAQQTPTNLIYDILITHIGPAVVKHIDEIEYDHGYINNWDIRMTKRLYSIEALVEFFDKKIDEKRQPTIRFVDINGDITEDLERDGVYVKPQCD